MEAASTAVELTQGKGGVWARLKVIGQLIRRYPHVLLVPLCLWAVMMTLGIWGVHQAQVKSGETNRQFALWEAQGPATILAKELSAATLPLLQLAEMVNANPNVASFLKLWDAVIHSWWSSAPLAASSVTMNAQGVILRVDTPHGSAGTEGYIGVNAMSSQADQSIRQAILYGLMQPPLYLVGPWSYQDLQFDSINVTVGISRNIFFTADANETWGTNHTATDCPPGLCYNPQTRRKWWGSVAMNMDLGAINASTQDWVLSKKGYSWQLLKQDYGATTQTNVFTLQPAAVPAHAMRTPVAAVDQKWELVVWQGDTWEDNMGYLYAAVVVGSTVISVLLFAVLLSWVENSALLYSLLPKHTLARMKAEATWATSPDDEFEAIKLETPAQVLLHIISTCLNGVLPPMPRLLAMRDALHRSVDVYRPTANTVKEKMQEMDVDAEVRRALVAQLVDGDNSSTSDDPRESALLKEKAIQDGQDDNASARGLDAIQAAQDLPSPGSKAPHDRLIKNGGIAEVRITQDGAPPLSNRVEQILQLIQVPQGAESVKPTSRALSAALLDGEKQNTDDTRTELVKPLPSLVTEVESQLKTVDGWEFDAYAFEVAAQGQPLSVMGFWLLQRTGLIKWANMDVPKLVRFLNTMESGYSNTNTYHNRRHASDVLQSMHVVMHRGGLIPVYVDQLTMLACYMAATMHDYDHRGRTNDFLINTHDDLAVRYNDRSPMENHHLAAAFSVLKNPDMDCLSGLSKTTWTKVRKMILDLVLATDMKQHFAILGQFDALNSASAAASTDRPIVNAIARTPRPSGPGNPSRLSTATPELTSLSKSTYIPDSARMLVLQIALKCSDLGHLSAPLAVHLKWVKDLEEEYFRQGDIERELGLPISPLCDRQKEGVYKSQVGFFEFVAMPLFKALTTHFKQCGPLIVRLAHNAKYWQSISTQKTSVRSPK